MNCFIDEIKDLLNEGACFVGTGNYLRSDDAAGLFVIDGLMSANTDSERIRFINAEDVLEGYVFRIAEMKVNNVIIIDAVKADAEPGSILFGRFDESALTMDFSTHKQSAALSARILKKYNKNTWLIGIVVKDTDYGTGFTAEVLRSAENLRDTLIKLLNSSLKENAYVH
jgi:hydrogenase maturation protease